MEPQVDIRFDGWTLCCGSGELAKDGSRIRLQSQPLAVLKELLARPGELVTREYLIARLWPRGVVDYDTALNSAVRRLRHALGDHADAPRYIETIPKRGYRFIARLDPPSLGRPGVAARSRRWAAAAGLLLGLATLAVVGTSRGPIDSAAGPTATVRSAAGVDPVEATARERVVRARFLFQRRAPQDVALARRYFTQATEIDPRQPDAWAGLASATWIEIVEGRLPAAVGLPALREAGERALALDPGSAEAHLRLANYRWRTGDREAGDEHLRRAIAANPDHPLVLSFAASDAVAHGRLAEGIALQQRSVAADPLSISSRYNLAVWLYLAGRIDDARDALLEIREIHPNETNPGGLLSLILILDRQFGAALELVDGLPDDADQLQARALAYSGLGRSEDADAALRALLESPQPPDPIRVAEVFAYRGERDRAFEWLHAALESDSSGQCARRACWPLEMARESPFLEPLRSDPRWVTWTRLVQDRRVARAQGRGRG